MEKFFFSEREISASTRNNLQRKKRRTVIEIGCIDDEREKGDPPPTRQEQVEADETQRRHIS